MCCQLPGFFLLFDILFVLSFVSELEKMAINWWLNDITPTGRMITLLNRANGDCLLDSLMQVSLQKLIERFIDLRKRDRSNEGKMTVYLTRDGSFFSHNVSPVKVGSTCTFDCTNTRAMVIDLAH